MRTKIIILLVHSYQKRMNTRLTYVAALAAAVFLGSCESRPEKNHGAIVLGDSSSIVTENDPQRLKDLVTDLQPAATEEDKESDNKPTPADTAKVQAKPAAAAPAQQPAQQALPNVPGLKAEFKDVTVLIPGLSVKQAGRANLEKANGTVYTLQGGEINGNTLKTSGNVTKVSQRYQTVVLMKNDFGTLTLDDLSVTTGWQELPGSNGTYKIAGLDARSLRGPDADAGDIRDALNRAARRRRWSRRKTQELLNELRHVRGINQRPLSLVLRSVMWKIDGKDAQGRQFSKQVRVDIPL
jgi:hypothetical protein